MENEKTGKPRRTPVWKILAVIGGVLAVCIGGFAVWINTVAARKMKELEERFARRAAEERARPRTRPVLYGDAVPGEAWTFYTQAMQKVPRNLSDEVRFYADSGDPLPPGGTGKPRKARKASSVPPKPRLPGDPPRASEKEEAATSGETESKPEPSPEERRRQAMEKVRTEIEPHTDVCALLRQGATAAEGGRDRKWEDGFAMDITGLLASQNVCTLISARARMEWSRGDRREALLHLLDVAQFALDLSRSATLIEEMIGVACMTFALNPLREWLERGELGPGELTLLGDALDRADSAWPDPCDVMRNESLLFDATMVKMASGTIQDEGFRGLASALLAWKYGFSIRILAADASEEFEWVTTKSDGFRSLPWRDRSAKIQAVHEKALQRGNPLLRHFLPGIGSAERAVWERRSQLALLRAAVRIRRMDDFPEAAPKDWPADPFGSGPLGYRRSADGATCTIWGFGPNGVDDGGKGRWKGMRENDAEDMVLELKAKP